MSNTEEVDVYREIQEVIAVLVQDGEDGREPAVFDAEGLDKIAQAVDFYLEEHALIEAVETVLYIAHLLETEQSSPTAARQLVAIVDREIVIDALKRLNREKDDERHEDVAKTAEQFSKFGGEKAEKKAPTDQEEAPKGSLKLGALDFPKRM